MNTLGPGIGFRERQVHLRLHANEVEFSSRSHLVHDLGDGRSVDFAVLGYAITSMETETYRPSRLILLGEDATPELRRATSLDALVTRASPPFFLWHTAEDEYVPPEHTYRLAAPLAAHDVPHAVGARPNAANRGDLGHSSSKLPTHRLAPNQERPNVVLAGVFDRQLTGLDQEIERVDPEVTEPGGRIDPAHVEQYEVPILQAVAFPNLRPVGVRRIPFEVNARWQNLRLVGPCTHGYGVIPKGLVDGEDERRPAYVRLLDDARETSERPLGHETMEFVDEVVDKRNACSVGLTDSGEGVKKTKSDDDVGPEFSELAPNLE